MARVAFHCARVSGDNTCSVKIFGERDDVVQAAHDHLVQTHGLTQDDDPKGKVHGAVDENPTKETLWGS
jgi:predicted small metal-binding protein